MILTAVDPGSEQSAYVVWDQNQGRVISHGILPNQQMAMLLYYTESPTQLVVEQVKSYGLRVSDPVFETAHWGGYFCAMWDANKQMYPQREGARRVSRREVRSLICGTANTNANDSAIRTELINRFGPPLQTVDKRDAKGNLVYITKGTNKGQPKKVNVPNPVYGTLVKDEWQAFALAVAFCDLNNE